MFHDGPRLQDGLDSGDLQSSVQCKVEGATKDYRTGILPDRSEESSGRNAVRSRHVPASLRRFSDDLQNQRS